jgi:hypothetical protein
MKAELLRNAELHAHLDSILRMADDAMSRAKDQLEDDEPDLTSLGYVGKQINFASDKILAANEIVREMITAIERDIDIDRHCALRQPAPHWDPLPHTSSVPECAQDPSPQIEQEG